MSHPINLNADIGEGFGAYRMGDDEGLLDAVQSVNVACGFHGGDPTIMRRICMAAAARSISIGAHPGFGDLWGFGRRRIEMRADDLEYSVAYQIGALAAMAAYAGIRVTHVKPHGALHNMAFDDADYALAIGRAIKTVDPALIYLVMPGSEMEKAAFRLGLPVAREGFIDRLYTDDGRLQSRRIAGSVVSDPAQVAARAVLMATEGVVETASGARLRLPLDSLCVHGDEPNAVAVARAARTALEASGVALVTLPAMVVGAGA